MTLDLFDPGPNNDFPHMPRNEDGTIDRSRVGLGPPVQQLRVNGVLTRLDVILDQLDAEARQ